MKDLDESIKYLINVKDDNRISDKFANLSADEVYDFLIELKKLRSENEKLKKRVSALKNKLNNKNLEKSILNPYDMVGILIR